MYTATSLRSAPPVKTLSACLHDIREHLVHLADLRGDAVVDCTVADLNDEAAEDIGLDLFYRRRK
jgi:hypothetical protein